MASPTPSPKPAARPSLAPNPPLDPSRWQSWLKRGEAHDQRTLASWRRAAKWAALSSLFAATGLWYLLTPYDLLARFFLTSASLLCAVLSIGGRQPHFALGFTAFALAFNPVYPLAGLPTDWRMALVALGSYPFASALLAEGRAAKARL